MFVPGYPFSFPDPLRTFQNNEFLHFLFFHDTDFASILFSLFCHACLCLSFLYSGSNNNFSKYSTFLSFFFLRSFKNYDSHLASFVLSFPTKFLQIFLFDLFASLPLLPFFFTVFIPSFLNLVSSLSLNEHLTTPQESKSFLYQRYAYRPQTDYIFHGVTIFV